MPRGKYSNWTRGDDEALLNRHGGEEAARAFIRGERIIVTPKEPPLLHLVNTIEVSAHEKFMAAEVFTEANGIARMNDVFQGVMLRKTEFSVPYGILTISELTRHAQYFRVATTLNIDERGTVALAHFFELLDRQRNRLTGSLDGPLCSDRRVAAALIKEAGDIWVVSAQRFNNSWHIRTNPLGDCIGSHRGDRFLSC